MADPASSTARLGSIVVKKRKRAGTHLITGAAVVVVPPASPAPSAVPQAPRLKSVPASRAQPKASRNLLGDCMKKKQTVKRTTLPPVASEPDVLDAPLVDDIVAANVFDDMPNMYEIKICRFCREDWLGPYEYAEFCNVTMMRMEFLPLSSSF
jgi:hypothetical protein